MYVYPDVSVICGEPKFVPGRRDVVTNPALIIEVLSPTTERYDRGFKSPRYRSMERLQEYAIVCQTEPRVEIYHRLSGNDWLLKEPVGLESVCTFDSVHCSIPMWELYGRITFASESEAPEAGN
jgi:Uma2 family endonuclease